MREQYVRFLTTHTSKPRLRHELQKQHNTRTPSCANENIERRSDKRITSIRNELVIFGRSIRTLFSKIIRRVGFDFFTRVVFHVKTSLSAVRIASFIYANVNTTHAQWKDEIHERVIRRRKSNMLKVFKKPNNNGFVFDDRSSRRAILSSCTFHREKVFLCARVAFCRFFLALWFFFFFFLNFELSADLLYARSFLVVLFPVYRNLCAFIICFFAFLERRRSCKRECKRCVCVCVLEIHFHRNNFHERAFLTPCGETFLLSSFLSVSYTRIRKSSTK